MCKSDSRKRLQNQAGVTYLGDFTALWFRVISICATDNVSEIGIKLFTRVHIHGSSNCPDKGEKKQTLHPKCDLKIQRGLEE